MVVTRLIELPGNLPLTGESDGWRAIIKPCFLNNLVCICILRKKEMTPTVSIQKIDQMDRIIL